MVLSLATVVEFESLRYGIPLVPFVLEVVVDKDITCENIVCMLDNHEPIKLSLTGRCVAQPADAVQELSFETEVGIVVRYPPLLWTMEVEG